MSLVVFFDQPEAGQVAVAGGKGSNLSSLTRAGFPVPPGFVVTAAAYERFLDTLPDLDDTLAGFDYDHPDRLWQQCGQLLDRLARQELPADVRSAIAAGLEQLGPGPCAVRSSSTFEDLAQAAFAGQHDTFLNVRSLEAVCDRVRDCFASLWGDRAVLYRHRQGFAQRLARMAVVVQRQIACDRAGVGFSVDPVSGRPDRVVVEANYGLGESVVAGGCEIDHFTLDKKTLAVLDRSVGNKERMLAATADGVEERPVPADLAGQPCLSDAQLEAVARLVLRAESHFGWPQDIEWGWQGETLYQFQSRPVTTLPPRWTRDESAERFPGPVTPLTWDLLSMAFRASTAHSLVLMGLPPLQADFFGLFDHHVYGNQNALDVLAAHRPLRARTPQELAAEIPELRRRYSWVLDLPLTWARDLDRYLLRLGRLSAVPLDDTGPREVWQHLQELLDGALEYFGPNLAITTTGAFLHRLLHGLVGLVIGPERALNVVDGLLAGCETKTVVVNRELHELARLAARTPLLAGALVAQGARAVWEQGRLAEFPAFAARFGRFLDDHGHREMDMDYYHPTWSGQPWVVLDAVTLILKGGAEEDPAEAARCQRLRHAETELQFLGEVPEDLRFFFRELVRLARTYTALDDLEHYQTTRLNPVCRRLALALGRHLRQRGILDAPEDVFFLHKNDLEELVKAWPDVDADEHRRRAAQAKASYEASKRKAPPWVLDGGEPAGAEGECLRGLPGSPGRVTGPCFLVTRPEDFGRFPKGAVLVAPTTNPAWTPLFYSAGGLVTESGGPLSHGAVTAREMRLPAVMSVRGVMRLLHDGQVVTVDGTQGVVRVQGE
jgi:pyruvate,water dikinase